MTQKIILIVEDHDAVRRSLIGWLGPVFSRHQFIEAASGEEAVRICRTVSPDVVLMDIGLPLLNGIETTKRIKSIAPAAEVVMLTIHEDERYRADASTAGATAYVPKRLMQKELLPVLTALLCPGEGQPSIHEPERHTKKTPEQAGNSNKKRELLQ